MGPGHCARRASYAPSLCHYTLSPALSPARATRWLPSLQVHRAAASAAPPPRTSMPLSGRPVLAMVHPRPQLMLTWPRPRHIAGSTWRGSGRAPPLATVGPGRTLPAAAWFGEAEAQGCGPLTVPPSVGLSRRDTCRGAVGGRDCNTLSRCWSGFLLPAAQEKPILQAGPKPNSSPVMLPLWSSLSWTSFTFPVQPLRGQAAALALAPSAGGHPSLLQRSQEAPGGRPAGPRRPTQQRLREAAMHVAARGPGSFLLPASHTFPSQSPRTDDWPPTLALAS